MSLFYDPFFDIADHLREFRRMQRDMGRLVDRVGLPPSTDQQESGAAAAAAAPAGTPSTAVSERSADRFMSWFPVVDIKENDGAIMVHAELPGLKKEDINISVDKGVLNISGKREFEKKEENDKWHRVERSYGSFHRSFRLPENVKESDIAAVCNDGVLTVTIPKDKKPEPSVRRITIQ